MEKSLEEREEHTHNKAEKQGKYYLKHGLNQNGNYSDGISRHKSLRNTEGNSKKNKTDCIVKSNYGEKNVRKRSLSLVLTNDHQRCRRSSCRCDSSKYDSGGKGEQLISKNEMQTDKCGIDQKGCENSLNYTDNGCLLSCLFQLAQTELVTDGKCDKAESNV